MLAHVGGAPVEELLFPFLASTGAMLVAAARVTFNRANRRDDPRR